MDQMQDKVVVITGGSDGIGKALVELYLIKGAKVATCARNYQKLYQLQSANTGKSLFIHATDVSKEIDCKGFIDAVIKEFGTIDILINIYNTMSHNNTIHQLKDTKLGKFFSENFKYFNDKLYLNQRRY